MLWMTSPYIIRSWTLLCPLRTTTITTLKWCFLFLYAIDTLVSMHTGRCWHVPACCGRGRGSRGRGDSRPYGARACAWPWLTWSPPGGGREKDSIKTRFKIIHRAWPNCTDVSTSLSAGFNSHTIWKSLRTLEITKHSVNGGFFLSK